MSAPRFAQFNQLQRTCGGRRRGRRFCQRNLAFAALSGVLIPLLVRKVGVDPALASAVILTTVTDVVGFFSFLGLATLFLI